MSTPRSGKLFVLLLVLITVTTVGFTTGYGVGTWQTKQQQQANMTYTEPLQSALFWQVWKAVQDDYITQPVVDQDLFYGAIHGLASAVGDPYTVFFDPTESKAFSESLNGSFEGIGAEIGEREGQIVVIAPLPNSPAALAGLQTNDAIIKIDDFDTYGLSVDEAIEKIRGPKGTAVMLTIYRAGASDLMDISITRDTIDIPSAEYTTEIIAGQTIATISLVQIDETSAEDMRALLNQVLLDQPQGLILDLRSNPGGVLEDAIDISSLFLDSGLVVSEEYGDGTLRSYEVSVDAILPDQPKLVVLMNGGSASAAEIIAGALQDHKRAYVIGQTSFGKGSVQSYQEFPDGSSLKMTVAHWLTPNQRTIDGVGITPDVVVESVADEGQVDEQRQAAIEYLME